MLQKVHDTHKSQRHLEPLVHIRVECTTINGQGITDYHIPHGVHELMIPESTLQEVKDLVETKSLDEAEERYHLEVNKWMKEEGSNKPEQAPWSVSKAFKIMYVREIRPLRSLEVLAEGLDPELTPEQRSIAAVSQAVAKGQAVNRKGKRAE